MAHLVHIHHPRLFRTFIICFSHQNKATLRFLSVASSIHLTTSTAAPGELLDGTVNEVPSPRVSESVLGSGGQQGPSGATVAPQGSSPGADGATGSAGSPWCWPRRHAGGQDTNTQQRPGRPAPPVTPRIAVLRMGL